MRVPRGAASNANERSMIQGADERFANNGRLEGLSALTVALCAGD